MTFIKDSAVVDHNFFSVPGRLNSYIAGFIAADGCILKDRILQIAINVKDQEHLRSLRDAMKSTATITYGKDNTAKISIPSTQIGADLKANFGIVPRKSLVLQPPPLANESNIKAFIAGYIDGDGCWRYGGRSKNSQWKYIILEVVGTQAMLQWINEQLPHTGTIRDFDTYAKLQISCKKAFDVYNYLLQPDLPLLERKWNKQYKISTKDLVV